MKIKLDNKDYSNIAKELVKTLPKEFVTELAKSCAYILRNDKDIEPIYSVKEVSKILEVTEETVRRYLNHEILEGVKQGKNWIINQSQLNKYIHGKK